MANHYGETFPWGTLIINVSGSFVIGFFATLTSPGGAVLVRPEARSFFMIGFCGGYTTFSTFSFEALSLGGGGYLGLSALYLAGSVGLGVAGAAGGMALARALAP